MTLPPDPEIPIPNLPPFGLPDPPITEPEPDRLPDENPVPNPDENPSPPQHVGQLEALRDLS